MEFAQVMRKRRMIRSYEDRPVPEDFVERIVRNGLRAPSAGFSQGWAFLVLTESPDRERFFSVAAIPATGAARGLAGAPLVIVALSHKQAYLDRYAEPDKGWTDRAESRWPVAYWDIDASFAALQMHLTAIDLGLGTCFSGIPSDRIPAFKDAFGVPDAYHPVGYVTAGYPAADVPSPSLRRGHRPVEEVLHRGRW
ncbi:MAG: nitroreductase family protein [Candidatus Dormibacteraceae bacterium]